MKKFLPLMAAVMTAVLLWGCGSESDPDTLHYAVVMGPEGVNKSKEMAEVADAVSSYCGERGYITKTFTATAATAEAYAAQFSAAAEEGAAYIVCQGRDMEAAVNSAQEEHKKTNFIFVDGVPRESAEKGGKIRGNTECLIFDKAQMGFLAGYTAVREGYRSITWMTGVEDEEGQTYYQGFLRGAAYAAGEIGLGAAELKIQYEAAGADGLSPRRTADAEALFGGGCEIILTDQLDIARAVARAAETVGGVIGTVGEDGTQVSTTVLFSVTADRTTAIRTYLDTVDNSSGFEGGTELACGASHSGLRLNVDYSRLTSFTQDHLRSVLGALAGGNASAEGADGAETGLSVTTVQPTAGDPEAGINENERFLEAALAENNSGSADSTAGTGSDGGETSDGGDESTDGGESSDADSGE